MIDCLFIAHDAHDLEHQPLHWQSSQGPVRRLSLSAAAQALGQKPIALVLPGPWVSACAVQLATRKSRWLQKAMQYAAEEFFASDLEQLHLSLGETLKDGRVRVLATARQRLRNCLEQATAAGLNVQAIYAEHDLLPREQDCALVLEHYTLIGGSGESRMVCANTQWPSLAREYGFRTFTSKAPYSALLQGQKHATNLAQGAFALNSQGLGLKRWRPLLGLLGLWFALQCAFDLGQSLYLQRYAEGLESANRALYQQLFPQEARIVNLRAQFDAHLQQAQQQSTAFASLLAQATQAIGSAALTVEVIEYQEQRAGLTLELKAKDFSELEQLRQHLNHAGIAAQLGSANREQDGVSARMMIGAET